MSLTTNAISQMYTMAGSQDNPAFTPVVQVIHIKQIEAKGAEDRYKVIISDGNRHFASMCATQLNSLVQMGQISNNCLLRITQFIVNTMGSGQKVCIIMGCENAGPNPGERIGNPQDVQKHGPLNVAGGWQQQQSMGAQPMYGNVQSNSGGASNPYKNAPATNPYGSNNSSGTNRYQHNPQSSSPIVKTSATGQPITPIAGLNMYSNRWVIRAKITNKSEIRTWSNAKGEGSLFSIVLLDSSGFDVKCTFFKEAVDKFYNMLEEGKVYNFSGGRLKVANMQYNTCKSQFEITFDQNSEIHLDNDGGDIQETYEFKKIADLEHMEPNSYVDILGVVKHVGEVSTIIAKKSGKEMIKCELTVEDDSHADVRLTLWGQAAQNAPGTFANCPVVAFKKARLGDFGGRSLSGGNPSLNPCIPQTNQLAQWWALNGNKTQSRSLSSGGGGVGGRDSFDQRKEVRSIKEEHMGNNEKPDYLNFKATFNFIKREKQGGDDSGGCWYTACANSGEPCKNMFKATQTSDGNWHCDKCQQTYPNCVRRFIISACVADDTATTWVSLYNEQAETLFEGVTADQLYQNFIETNDKDLYNSTFLKSTYTEWVMTCKVKQELVGDETRTKTSIVRMSPVDYVKESRNILTALAAF
ncbi:hypothetical protein ACHAW6_012791 [Cyclotella cf. meneghiniana]